MKNWVIVIVVLLAGVKCFVPAHAEWIDHGLIDDGELRPFFLYQRINDSGELVETVIVMRSASLGGVLGIHVHHMKGAGIDVSWRTAIKLVGVGPGYIELIEETGELTESFVSVLKKPNQSPATYFAMAAIPPRDSSKEERLVFKFSGSTGTLAPVWIAPISLELTPYSSSSYVWITPKLH